MNAPVRVAVTGLGRQDVTQALTAHGNIEVTAMSDIEAATTLQQGGVSYIVGVCESGGGAALAMSIAIVGADACTNLSRMGRPVDAQTLPALLDSGVRVFGVARDQVAAVVPSLARAFTGRAGLDRAGSR